jgi:hypothetical protein
MAPAILRALRPALLICGLTPSLAAAEARPRVEMLFPEPGCEAPALVPAAALRQVQDAAPVPPPFRRAVLSCAGAPGGPAKRPLRRT